MTTEIDFKKEYLPGYTGHVPKRMEIFGCTAGDANRIIISHSRKSSVAVDPSEAPYMTNGRSVAHAKRTLYSNQPPTDESGHEIQFGNASKRGSNWIGGPTQNLKEQFIPGYQGFVPSIRSENIFGKSFAKGTSTAINKEFSKGFNLPTHQRYLSQNIIEHGKANFRRIRDKVEPADSRDATDATNFHDSE